jgi:cellobionic acid phosphorylase
LRGVKEGLKVDPKLPSHWDEMKATRLFRGAIFEVEIKRSGTEKVEVTVDGDKIDGNIIKNAESGKTYKVEVKVPQAKQ